MRFGLHVLVGLLLLGPVLASCGKKGDPFLPAREPANMVSGLEGTWNGENVLLTGRVKEPSKVREGEGFRVYYAVYPLDDPPCDGCPIEYQGYQPFGREAVTGDVFSFAMPEIRRGNIYYFEVRVIGPDGSPGPPSKRVRVEVPKGTE